MIFDHLSNLSTYKFKEKNMQKVQEFLLENDILALEEKNHVIVKDEIFINCFSVKQENLKAREYEAHSKFVDIHITLSGCDFIRSTQKSNLTITSPYNDKDDFLLGSYDGLAYCDANISRGYFVIYYPDDAHLVNGSLKDLSTIKKFVIKVKVN